MKLFISYKIQTGGYNVTKVDMAYENNKNIKLNSYTLGGMQMSSDTRGWYGTPVYAIKPILPRTLRLWNQLLTQFFPRDYAM